MNNKIPGIGAMSDNFPVNTSELTIKGQLQKLEKLKKDAQFFL